MIWEGFFDNESGIHKYSVCLSTLTKGSCDVHSHENIYSGNDIVLFDLNLKPYTEYFVTVVACNNVNLCSESSSRPFVIDNSPPNSLTNVTLTTYSSLKPNTQFDNTYISIAWEMEDLESPMYEYIISMKSHHDGEIPIFDLRLGDIKSTTIPLRSDNYLKDGSIYFVEVLGCNSAFLCTLSSSNGILVDSSRPVLGGFVSPMFWKNSASGVALDLAWKGFADPHSGILQYHIMISTAYNGYDLSNGVITVSHNASIDTQRKYVFLPGHSLEEYSIVYLSIWAENGVGLKSDAAKASVTSVALSADSGLFEIEKHSCEIHYCTGDCTCAVVNQKCVMDSPIEECTHLNETDNNINVYDGLYNTVVQYTPSSHCLAGYWINNVTEDLFRYEWSVSMLGYDAGIGILDIHEDKIWFDVELYDRSVFCHTGNSTFSEGMIYNYHTRVWYGPNTYSIHKSSGVMIDISPPSVGMGRHIKDTDADSKEEIDYTSRLYGIYSDWENVFSDQQSGIDRFHVAVGTESGGMCSFNLYVIIIGSK